MYDAVNAKDDVLNRLGGQIYTQVNGLMTVRIGFGKAESAPPTPASTLQGRLVSNISELQTPPSASRMQGAVGNTTEPHLQTSPTRALWIGSIPASTSYTDLLKVFSPYGAIESARVLVHKQCGFCNFENIDDAVRARKALNGKEILGNDVGPVRIGFAKVPNKVSGTSLLDNGGVANPTSSYASMEGLSGSGLLAEEQEGHRSSPIVHSLFANDINGVGLRSATSLTAGLQPAVGLSPSLVASEFGASAAGLASPAGVMPSIAEQQVLMRELSEDSADADALSQIVVGVYQYKVYILIAH